MAYLTRRERDGAVALGTSLLASFFAGFFSAGQPYIVASDYSAGLGLIIIATVAYLGYRVIRRVGGYALGRLRTHRADRAQADTIIAGTVIVILGTLGIVIVSIINTNFDSPTNTGLSEGQQAMLAGFGSMIDLIQPLLIVLMAGVLILAVARIARAG